MAPNLDNLLGSIGLGNLFGGGVINLVFAVGIGFIALILIIGLFLWFFKYRKNWNLNVEFKIPRSIQENSDGSVSGVMSGEWGKGAYDSRRGVVWLKRKGIKKVPMKPFDVKTYLQGKNLLTVIQVGVEDYKPIVQESYFNLIDDKTNEEASLVKFKIDTSQSKSWKNTFERESKSAYTILSWLAEHGQLVGIGIILLMNFVGFTILWNQVR